MYLPTLTKGLQLLEESVFLFPVDVPLPNTMPGPHAKPLISKGEPFYLIHGVRSFYIGTTSGRIFAVRSKDSETDNGPDPLIQGPGGQVTSMH